MHVLQEDPNDLNYRLTPRNSPGYDKSKVFYGYLGSTPLGWAEAAADQPFSFDDPDRINQTIACMRKLAGTDLTQTSSLLISSEGVRYLNSLKQLLGQSNPETLRKIAVLEDEFQNLTGTRFVNTFLQIADEMDRLGLTEIMLQETDPKSRELTFSTTSAWLRHVYGQEAA
ncbi:hypothetical protein HYT18_05355 [Candidatus Microgenomates bacterium]|nr:hypothetical protein [Candidatus Microgenomates bacterium]